MIGGGFAALPLSTAWYLFEEGNGVESPAKLQARYRRAIHNTKQHRLIPDGYQLRHTGRDPASSSSPLRPGPPGRVGPVPSRVPPAADHRRGNHCHGPAGSHPAGRVTAPAAPSARCGPPARRHRTRPGPRAPGQHSRSASAVVAADARRRACGPDQRGLRPDPAPADRRGAAPALSSPLAPRARRSTEYQTVGSCCRSAAAVPTSSESSRWSAGGPRAWESCRRGSNETVSRFRRVAGSGASTAMFGDTPCDGVRRLAVQVLGNGLVCVAGQRGCGVAELLLDDLDVDAGVEGHGGCDVS